MMNFGLKTRNCVSKTRNCAFKVMNFAATSASDPATPFVDQGWWGSDAQCGRDHCCRKTASKLVGTLPFPYNWTINMTSNNAAAVLMPDRETLVQFQPLVRDFVLTRWILY